MSINPRKTHTRRSLPGGHLSNNDRLIYVINTSRELFANWFQTFAFLSQCQRHSIACSFFLFHLVRGEWSTSIYLYLLSSYLSSEFKHQQQCESIERKEHVRRRKKNSSDRIAWNWTSECEGCSPISFELARSTAKFESSSCSWWWKKSLSIVFLFVK